MSLALVRRWARLSLVTVASTAAASAQIAGSNWQAEGNQVGALGGCAVASAGDVNGDGYDDVLVGARSYDGSFSNEGRVSLFLGSASGLASSPAWSAYGGQPNANFGVSVAGADVNGDGHDDVLVGASAYSNGQSGEGVVFLYVSAAGALPSTPSLVLEADTAGAAFGFALANAGDVDADGTDDVLVGAPGYNADAGAAFLYLGATYGLLPYAAWSIQGSATSKLGGTVARAGDVDGNGYDDVIVGAQYDDTGASDGGAAFVYQSWGSLNTSPDLSLYGTQVGGGLGNAVAGVGDVNADGYDDVAVAAQRYDEPAMNNAGRVYLLVGSSGGVLASPTSVISGTQSGAMLGSSVAAAGYFDLDAYADVVVGARYHDNGQLDEGRAYVYRGSATGWMASPVLTVESNQASADLGFAVGGACDVQSDGGSDVLVGAPSYDAGQSDEGVALGYYGAPRPVTTWYVDGNATPPYLGTYAQPFLQIQDAIEHPQVRDGDTVWVWPGSYEAIDFLGKGVRIASTSGSAATSICGCAFPCNSYRDSTVYFTHGETSSSVLDGFWICGGSGTYLAGYAWVGGGIFCAGATPIVRNCVISGAFIDAQGTSGGNAIGGGVFTSSAIELRGCTIFNNTVMGTDEGYAAGGGVYGPAVVDGCTIESNSVNGDSTASLNGDPVCGGGVAYATVTNSTLRGNSVSAGSPGGYTYLFAHAEGGGAFASPLLENCVIEENVVITNAHPDFVATDLGFGGGAARSTLADCLVRGNRVTFGTDVHGPNAGGGGVYLGSAVRCVIEDNVVDASFGGGTSRGGGVFGASYLERCVLQRNVADYGGGASTTGLDQCTLFHNVARFGGGAIDGCPAAFNSILWGSTPDEAFWVGAAPLLDYCDIDDASLATGTNFQLDPEFWNPNVGDVHLRPGSPCIDAADPFAQPDPNGSRADVGALPFDVWYCSDPVAYCTARVNSLGCVPSIGWVGQARASGGSPCWITCTDVISQKTGIFFYGTSGRASFPFQGGTMCVAAPLRRTPLQSSGGSASGADCTGVFAIDFNAWIATGADANLVHGAQVDGEYWYRDPQSPSTTGLSNAIELVVGY